MDLVKVTNITDRELEFQAGPRSDGPWLAVKPGETVEVREDVAYGCPAADGDCAHGGLLEQEDNWKLAGGKKSKAAPEEEN